VPDGERRSWRVKKTPDTKGKKKTRGWGLGDRDLVDVPRQEIRERSEKKGAPKKTGEKRKLFGPTILGKENSSAVAISMQGEENRSSKRRAAGKRT